MPRQLKILPEEWPELAAAADVKPTKLGPEDLFAAQLEQIPGLKFERQVQFAKAATGRKWAFDFAFSAHRVAVEIDGVVVRRIGGQLIVQGGHATIQGIRNDQEKHNTAAMLGWYVLRFLQSDVKPRHAIDMTLRVLAARGWRSDC